MLRKVIDTDQNTLYGVYYTVYGSLAGDDQLVKSYLWAGPYDDMKAAVNKAQELRHSHQEDVSFIVKKYVE
ncbi:MAG: hypothetical protein RLP02_27200 [Coleofasciculus sp. C2-GNP5-27]